MSGQTPTERDINSSTQEDDDSRKRPRDVHQNPLNGFHQGLMAHAGAGVSSQTWAGLRRKRSNVGGMFETILRDCAKENNESKQAHSAESIKAMTGPVQLSRNAGRAFQHDQQRSEGNSDRRRSASTPTRASDASVASSRSNPLAYRLGDFHGSRNEGSVMPSQVTRNDPIASHQPSWMQNQGRVPSYQPAATSRSMFDTTSSKPDHGLQPPPVPSSSTVSRTSLQPFRNDTRISMSAHQQGRNRLQQQGSHGNTNGYATGPLSLVINAHMMMASSIDTFALEGTGSCFSKLKSKVNSVSELISQQKTYCSSAEFEIFVSNSGLDQPHFKQNPHLEDSKFEKFKKAWNELAPDSKLSIVFHGTSKQNLPRILDNGLDARHRSRQAYGPGEYFSNDPGT